MDGQRIGDLDTPCLAVDLDVFEQNIELCMDRLASVRVRPHLKTAKSLRGGEPAAARGRPRHLRRQAGRGGGDARRRDRGRDDHDGADRPDQGPPAGRADIPLARGADPDRRRFMEGASAIDAGRLARPLETLVDVNVGQDRCGVAPEDALALADRVRELEQLALVGVQGYEGNLQHIRAADERRRRCDISMGRLEQAVRELRAGGHTIDVVTTGGTGTAEFCSAHEVVTEVQPGSFVFMDADYSDTGGLPYRPALTALATVISRPAPDRAVLDAGLKTLSNDSGPARLLDARGWSYVHAGDEHGVLTPADGPARRELRVGDRVTLQPSHIDTTINLHDSLYAHREGRLEAVWPVAARGKVQ